MRWIIVTLTLLFTAGSCDAPTPPAAPISTLIAPAAPPRVYTEYDELADLFHQRNDTTYLINFWATWCKPCLEELPLLQELAAEKDRPLEIVLVSLDTQPEAIARIPDYLAGRGVLLPNVVLTDERQEWKTALDEHWDGTLPTTFIYRNELRYVYRRNFRTLPDVREAVRPLLGG
ncbi:TlpA family protein disulfide reductase [Neolewinella sp.]|uniref:TlpA family protein disulfide reductase n=1 Tax=Neolewinella sp. TaxID=2993543 RepID=UPI003B525D85